MDEQSNDKAGGYGKKSVWKWVIIYILAAVVVYGAYYYFILSKRGGYTSAPSTYYPSTSQSQNNTSLVSPQSQVTPQTYVVAYTDSGFSPATITIKKGDTVTFKNTASDDMRVASNPHPIHNGYPTTGGCVGSTFDSCKNISPGQSWSFKFDFVGSWGYHNHLNPSEGGKVVVQ